MEKENFNSIGLLSCDIEDIKKNSYRVSELMLFKGHTNRYAWDHIPKISGVYLIINGLNNKVYLGASGDLHQRIPSHITKLKSNKHKKKTIQDDFNSIGAENFYYTILEITEDYDQREVFWFECFKGNCYNSRITPDSNKGLILSDESKKLMGSKVSAANKGKTPKNIEFIRSQQRRPILEYENGVFIREYNSSREAGRILNVCYKRINRVVVRNARSLKLYPLKEYPNKNWIYKDNKPVRIVNRNESK